MKYWHKELIGVTRNDFMSKQLNSCQKKTILGTGNKFLWNGIACLVNSINEI